MQGAAQISVSFSMRRDAAGLLMDFSEWQALRGALEELTTHLTADIPCPPEDIYPEDHGCVIHIEPSDGPGFKS